MCYYAPAFSPSTLVLIMESGDGYFDQDDF